MVRIKPVIETMDSKEREELQSLYRQFKKIVDEPTPSDSWVRLLIRNNKYVNEIYQEKFASRYDPMDAVDGPFQSRYLKEDLRKLIKEIEVKYGFYY